MFKYLKGSTTEDFDNASEDYPFESCADSPNCAIHSVDFALPAKDVWSAARIAIQKLSPIEAEYNSEFFKIDAVFRIPLFGFKDDVKIIVRDTKEKHSILFIKSWSRTGYSDLGVNRRRIKRILSAINHKLS